VAPRCSTVAYFSREPVLAPLVDLARQGAPRGAAILSAERIRLFERGEPGRLEELRDWELTLIDDWRERKAPMVPNPAAGRAVSAAGHDQFDERLEANRHRFLGECGRLAAAVAKEHGWSQVLAFGPPPDIDRFRDAFPANGAPAVEVGALRQPVEEAVARLDRERDEALVERALEESRGGSRATTGRQETAAALAEARVDHLLFDAALAPFGDGAAPKPDDADGAEAGSEPLVRSALASGATVTAVAGEAAEPLRPFDGVAALLRY
jgi:hypothetical protein